MSIQFLDKKININESLKNNNYDSCFVENNERQIEQICNFLQKDKKFFLVNGFKGIGKTSLVNYACEHVTSEVFVIKYTCFETTILDDMLLSFFESFRNFTIEGRLHPPKLKTESFSQRINLYFNVIKKPMLVVINSFETILKSNKIDILNFLKHISNYENVKIIITSRIFNNEDFADTDLDSTTVLGFTKEIFEKYLKSNDIKNIGVLSNELYKQSKGYLLYLNLSLRIMKLRNYNLGKFLEVFSKSLVSFPDFIIREALSFVDPVSLHLFRLLAIMRIPIHINLLKSLHLFNQNQIYFFIENSLISVEGECLYLADYFRDIIENQTQESVMVKLHKSCVELYNTQLPLKPFERDLRLSRQTMRNEIDYHSMYLPQKPVVMSINKDNNLDNEQIPNNELNEQTKQEKIEKINFIFEDENLLNNIADSISDYVNEKLEIQELEQASINLPLIDILNNAKEQENKYSYKNALLFYQSALTKKDDENYDKFLPTVYIKLANVYKHLSKWYEALEYYTKAQDYYINVDQSDMANEIKLEIANIYYLIYRQDNVNYILNKLDNDKSISNELRIKVNLLRAKTSDNLEDAYNNIEKCIPLVDLTTDKKLLTELYYRFGVVNDEKDDVKIAGKYYKKCIETEKNPKYNKYLSRALSNLAELYNEAKNPENAIKYYEKSIEIDKEYKNYSGLYTNSRHLAEIYSSKDDSKTLEYLNKSKEYAKQLNEPYYIVDVSIEIGNYYLLRNNYEQAYDCFNQAYEVAKYSFSKVNLDVITERIEYAKKIMKK